MLKDVTLSEYTSFMVGGNADHFIVVKNEKQLVSAIRFADYEDLPFLIIGEGCNLVVSNAGFRGVIIKNGIEFIDVVNEDNDKVVVQVGNGINWDDFVAWAVENEYWGIENLSLIPGSVGACPVQNIGAFGQEVSDVITQVKVFDTVSNDIMWLDAKDCEFGYRSSIFNKKEQGRYVILAVEFSLSKLAKPCFTYRDLANEFAYKKDVSIAEIREFIIDIRNQRLPDVKKIGNAGSFFKNVIVSESGFKNARSKLSEFVSGEQLAKFDSFRVDLKDDKGMIKIPTAFLIEVCGLKGYRKGDAAVFDKHALVLVNYGGARGNDIYKLAIEIQEKVFEMCGVRIYVEPMLVGFSEGEVSILKG